MKIFFLNAVLFITLFSTAQSKKPVDYVNPFIGASTSIAASGDASGLGKTFPGAATPFGMTQVSPNTVTGGDNGSGYSYEHKTIEGFALTQMSGVGWYGDLGNFLVMPTCGALYTNSGKEGKSVGYRSTYDKKTEIASAGYYSVMLTQKHIKAELTASPHGGIMRFTFPQNKESRIQIDLARRVGGTSTLQYVKKINDYTIVGWMKCTPAGGGWGDGGGNVHYTVYFYAEFSKPLKDFGIWSANIGSDWGRKLEDVQSQRYQNTIAQSKVFKNRDEMQGKHLGFYANFETKQGEQVILKTAISFVSVQGAEGNFKAELQNHSFNQVHQTARELWNTALSKIKVSGGTQNEKHIFYTALYHAMLDPRSVQDIDGKYCGGNDSIKTAKDFVKRSIFSGWDVFRSEMPLLTLVAPNVVNDLINSLTHLATESKRYYYPRWELLNAYSGCMIGNPAIPVITDAFKKGINHFDIQKAFQYCLNSVKKFDNNKNGFTSSSNSISKTLEYAYADWCLGTFAKSLNKANIAKTYLKKGEDYKNIFDKEKGWFRPKDENGNWLKWPAAGRLTDSYGTVESNPYQQGWFVPQDIPGMIQLMGGREKVLTDLTNFFDSTPENMHWNKYYNHANEPVHHVAYLFNYLRSPWLTQKWTRFICSHAYANNVEGLVGNDDVGQMSAWYVLAASGIAQICPGNMRYEITTPVFNKIVIHLGKKDFTILTSNNSPSNIYIQKAYLNGKPYNKCFLMYKDIIAGGELKLVVGTMPNKDWGFGTLD